VTAPATGALTSPPSGTSPATDVSSDARVRADISRMLQSRLLLDSGLALFGHPVLMGLVLVLTWPDIPHLVLEGWGIAVLLATLLRSTWLRTASQRGLSGEEVRFGVRMTVGLLGLCWGVGGAMVLRHASITDVALVLVVLAGIIAGSLSTLAADPASFFGFLATITLPLFIGLLATGQDRIHLATAVIVVFYSAVLTIVFRRAHAALVEQLRVTALLAESEGAAKRAEIVMRDARDLAERTAQARAAFLANMSHEIRTPMNAVLGFVELVLDTELSTEQRRALELVRSSSEALLTILNDILDYSKIEADHLELETIAFDLPKLVHATASLLAVRAREKHLELLADVPADVPRMVRGDPTRLRQVLTNLVGNAIKFTEEGEVVVTALARGNENGHTRVQFSVRDSGIGIAESHLKTIFDEFTQADASMTRRYGGTGLGLAISQKLVRLMGGELGVTSTVGKGSDFHFTLALPVESPASTQSAGRAALGGRRVLVVDDNPTNRRILRDMLGAEGVAVDEATSAAEGLEALRRAAVAGPAYDLTILDAQMPEQDGFQLAATARADPILRNQRLVMLTSAGQRGDGERCREVGIQAYLTKPISRSDLIEAVGTVLAGTTTTQPMDLITRHTIAESRPSLHILLAEDNVVNQQVAVAMLLKRGHLVDAVANGREAVAAVQQRPYDVVLMDIQMPEMDGFQATAAIRALPGKEGLPIIALTAHALSGERENCLARGMTGYLAKPFKGHELFALIEAPAEGGRAAPAATPPRESVPVDLDAFRTTLREAGAEEAIDSILETFIRQAPERLTALTAAFANKQSDAIMRAAHALRGAAATIGAQHLAGLLERIEVAARERGATLLDGDLEEVQAEAAAVLDYLQRKRRTSEARRDAKA